MRKRDIVILFSLVLAAQVALFSTIPPARADTFCDVPAKRPPLLEGPRNKVDYRVGKPFTDGGNA